MAKDEFDISRHNLADLYPRRDDPFRPGPAVTPGSAPAASLFTPEQLQQMSAEGADPFSLLLTPPGARPVVYQRANNFGMTVTASPQPLQAQQFQCDAIVINVPSTAANSVFFGYGSGVSLVSGQEVQPGLPISIRPENTREQWEVQRLLEVIAAMMAVQMGFSVLGQYRAPRVVLDASQYFVVAAANTAISVMLFSIPEQQ